MSLSSGFIFSCEASADRTALYSFCEALLFKVIRSSIDTILMRHYLDSWEKLTERQIFCARVAGLEASYVRIELLYNCFGAELKVQVDRI